jgi:hypothetical protein
VINLPNIKKLPLSVLLALMVLIGLFLPPTVHFSSAAAPAVLVGRHVSH